MRISVTMLARDAEKSIKETIKSLLKADMLRKDDELLVVDTGSKDKTKEVVESFGGRVISRPDLLEDMSGKLKRWLPEWVDAAKDMPQVAGGVIRDFSEARNIAMDAAENNVQFWIDSDDVLEEDEPKKLREVIDEQFRKRELSSIFLDYDYAHDDLGNVTVQLKRERIVDRTKYYWRAPCHEVLIPREGQDLGRVGYYRDLRSRISHRKPRERGKSCDIRNYLILKTAIEEEEKEKKFADTRLYFYFGNSCRGVKRYEDAMKMYALTLDRSGSRDDCFQAAYITAQINMTENHLRPTQALHWAHEAVKIAPSDPRGYFAIQHACYLLHLYEESLWWFEVGKQLPRPTLSLHLFNPQDIDVMPYIIAGMCYKELGQEGGILGCIEQLMRTCSGHPDIQPTIDMFNNWIAARNIGKSLYSLALNTGAPTTEQQGEKAIELARNLQSIPKEVEDRGIGREEPEDTREGEDLVFFCGRTAEDWGPQSSGRGMGGSERAIWEVSKRMQKRGFKVSIYNSCPKGERGIDKKTGVLWRHWAEFSKKLYRGTIVYWRLPKALEQPFPAEKRIVWCHDVQNAREWTNARVALADRVFVLSKFHKSTLNGALPDDKILITRNGIDTPIFKKALEEKQKNPKKIIYTSSPDRGILTALRVFKLAHKEDPELEFHAFYGFTDLFLDWLTKHWAIYVPDLNCEISLLRYMSKVEEEFAATEGAYNHGRVGWKEMAEHFAESGVWLYPTRFDEISCIGAMEAQAAGCCLVASDHAALKETIDWDSGLSFRVDPDDLDDCAAALLSASSIHKDDGMRKKLSKKAMKRFSWDTVCDEWVKEFSLNG